ncbi:uncharacterized protein [Nerophis lumbriciformis]|uniref:uncharacterized protein n=1 Tax=Nerophis lumbriciformis TaxID=546530 RepID=UPI002ADF3AE3|nr:zinc finger protein 2-like [Nerophis lumbriciformis]
MCKLQTLRVLVNQRLSAAAEEIFAAIERTMAEYREELEKERQGQLLHAVFNTNDVYEGHIHQGEPQPPALRRRSPRPPKLKRKRMRRSCPQVKEEEEEHHVSRGGLDQVDGTEMPLIGVMVRGEDDEVKSENEEKGDVEPPRSSSTQHMTEDDGGSPADEILAPLSDGEDTTSHSADTEEEDSKSEVTRHTDNTHFQCSHCGKTFKCSRNLKRHAITHTGEKPFPCSICGNGFSRKDKLKRHMGTHTGEKPFMCSGCGKRFSRKEHLETHMRIHTGGTNFPLARWLSG